MCMHFLTYVFIPPQADIDIAVAAAMRPYGDDFPAKPWKRYLDVEEIAAMAKCLGVRKSAMRKLAERMEKWNASTGGVDARGLYAVLTCNPDVKWDWYEIGGRWGGTGKLVFSALSLLRSAKKIFLPHDFVTPDGEWHARSRYVRTGWLNGRVIQKSEGRWRAEFSLALSSYPRHRVVCVDRHV